MFYVYCQENGEELMCDTMEEAEEEAQRIIKTGLLENDNPDLDCVILSICKVIRGTADIKFSNIDISVYVQGW